MVKLQNILDNLIMFDYIQQKILFYFNERISWDHDIIPRRLPVVYAEGIRVLPDKNKALKNEICTEGKMSKERSTVLLCSNMLDNVAPHPHLKMKNIKLVFFPPNMTSYCQPLDQGVIHQFKKLYRTQLVRKSVADLDANSSQPINVLDAIYWVSSSTKNIQPKVPKP
ncbi:hypothetical protein QTP88_012219 [Uroleucon formosanum]